MRGRSELPRGTALLALGGLGLYAGWTAVAVWANLSSALVAAGADPVATAWQAALLAGATATAVSAVLALRAPSGLVAGALWAFAGVAAGAAQSGSAPLATIAVAGGAATLAAAVARRRLTTWRVPGVRAPARGPAPGSSAGRR